MFIDPALYINIVRPNENIIIYEYYAISILLHGYRIGNIHTPIVVRRSFLFNSLTVIIFLL